MTNIERLKLEEECLSKYSKEEITQQYIDELEDNIKLTEYAEDLYDRINKSIEYINKYKNQNWYIESRFTEELLNILKGDNK